MSKKGTVERGNQHNITGQTSSCIMLVHRDRCSLERDRCRDRDIETSSASKGGGDSRWSTPSVAVIPFLEQQQIHSAPISIVPLLQSKRRK